MALRPATGNLCPLIGRVGRWTWGVVGHEGGEPTKPRKKCKKKMQQESKELAKKRWEKVQSKKNT